METKVDAKRYSAGEILQMFRQLMSEKKDKKLADGYPYDDAKTCDSEASPGSMKALMLQKYGKYMK